MTAFASDKRIQIFMGHYGSGKTSLAVNLALQLRRAGHKVTIADLDIVNPYFRTTDSRAELAAAGVALVASAFAGSNVDLPALPAELYAAIADTSGYALLDVGGDDRGAVALGRFAPEILSQGEAIVCFVVNFYRPLTQTAAEALAVLREVEAASGLRCTALVNNSNLGPETTAEDVLAAAERMEELSALSGLPVYLTSMREGLLPALSDRVKNAFPLALHDFATALNTGVFR